MNMIIPPTPLTHPSLQQRCSRTWQVWREAECGRVGWFLGGDKPIWRVLVWTPFQEQLASGRCESYKKRKDLRLARVSPSWAGWSNLFGLLKIWQFKMHFWGDYWKFEKSKSQKLSLFGCFDVCFDCLNLWMLLTFEIFEFWIDYWIFVYWRCCEIRLLRLNAWQNHRYMRKTVVLGISNQETVFSGLRATWFLAASPMSRSVSVKAT